jgi:hypothetical protein
MIATEKKQKIKDLYPIGDDKATALSCSIAAICYLAKEMDISEENLHELISCVAEEIY